MLRDKTIVHIIGTGVVGYACANFFLKKGFQVHLIGPQAYRPISGQISGKELITQKSNSMRQFSTHESFQDGGRSKVWGAWWSELLDSDLITLKKRFPSWNQISLSSSKKTEADFDLPKPQTFLMTTIFENWEGFRVPKKLLYDGRPYCFSHHFPSHHHDRLNRSAVWTTGIAKSRTGIQLYYRTAKKMGLCLELIGPVILALSPLQTARLLDIKKTRSYSNHRVYSVLFRMKAKTSISSMKNGAIFVYSSLDVAIEFVQVSLYTWIAHFMISEDPMNASMNFQNSSLSTIKRVNSFHRLNERVDSAYRILRAHLNQYFEIVSEQVVQKIDQESGVWHGLGTIDFHSENSKVQSNGKVKGFDSLWIADGSILPSNVPLHPSSTVLRYAHSVCQKIAE